MSNERAVFKAEVEQVEQWWKVYTLNICPDRIQTDFL